MTQRKPWSMFPSLHEDVSRLLEAEGFHYTFHSNVTETNAIQSFDTNIMGKFKCRNQSCRNRVWTSMKIAITIRHYSGERYNARVYHQRCKECQIPSKPNVDGSYAERIAYRLLKWRGVKQLPPVNLGRSKAPHQESLCEGCRAGHCGQGRVDGLLQELSRLDIGARAAGMETSFINAQTSRRRG